MKHLYLTIFLLGFLHQALPAQTNLYVSPKGNDRNKGSKDRPFATLEHAQMVARQIQDSTTIYLRAGKYYLAQTLVFKPNDSRRDQHPLTIRNYRNEQVTISGSTPLKMRWLPHKGGIYKAHINQSLQFDQLFVNGQQQRMARYPNYRPDASHFGGTAADAISKERVAKWSSPQGGFVHALHRYEWGGFHYLIKGKNSDGTLQLEGGWQNNRQLGMHDEHRYVENIMEELDAENEWYFDKESSTLYYFPPKGLDINKALIEIPQLAQLIEFRGNEKTPVSNINIKGITFTQTLRTFMKTDEPLLRSDWTIYRGGAILMEGVTNCSISSSTFENLGGNAIFVSRYNRNVLISSNKIANIGASAICFVGDPDAVRSPIFEYHSFTPLDQLDLTSGPKTNNYPANSTAYDNLIFNIGMIEKQSAGVQISMSMDIKVSHNTIYDVPRAGINISEGTWGGHNIEYNDVFNTVLETGDHGSFNSWGRDRYWHPNKVTLDSIVANRYELTMLDVIKPITIYHNRFRCDHGWDIDLDDGSSNYIIRNNVCLNGGIKLREGVNRVVENNIMVNSTFHPHVWFANSNDVFRYNIVEQVYMPIIINHWGKEVDYNLLSDSTALASAKARGTDLHSNYGDPLFLDPQNGDYRVSDQSPALSIGFKNFDMDSFGVVSPHLKKQAKRVQLPVVKQQIANNEVVTINFRGAILKNLTTLGEQSATGMKSISGVLVLKIEPNTFAAKWLKINDVILSLNGKDVISIENIEEISSQETISQIVIFRNQQEVSITI